MNALKTQIFTQFKDFKGFNWDLLGSLLSFFCILHCLTTPFLLAIFPLLNWPAIDFKVHLYLSFLIFPVLAFAFKHGLEIHKKIYPMWISTIGFIIILMIPLYEVSFPHVHQKGKVLMSELVFSLTGSSIIIFSHYLNLKLQKKAPKEGACSH